MNDFKKAEIAFKDYLKDYDLEDSKIKLKLVHTYGVVNSSIELARRLKLNEENTYLSNVIALLHDIGRFEQARNIGEGMVYDSADSTMFDHAKYGVKVLFEDGLIRKFVEDDKYDEIIKKAILNHNKIKIDEGLSKQELLQVNLIRDNDKIDNFRVKSTESLVDLLGTDDMQVIGNSKINDKVYRSFMNAKLVNYNDCQGQVDRWFSYMAYVYDLNFKESLDMLLENDMINKCWNRLEYIDQDTSFKVNKARKFMSDIIRMKII